MTAVGADEADWVPLVLRAVTATQAAAHVTCRGHVFPPGGAGDVGAVAAVAVAAPPLVREADWLCAGPRPRVSRQLGVHHRIARYEGWRLVVRWADPAMIGVGFETAILRSVGVRRRHSHPEPEPHGCVSQRGSRSTSRRRWARSSSRPEDRRPWDSGASGTRTSLACYRTRCLGWPSSTRPSAGVPRMRGSPVLLGAVSAMAEPAAGSSAAARATTPASTPGGHVLRGLE